MTLPGDVGLDAVSPLDVDVVLVVVVVAVEVVDVSVADVPEVVLVVVVPPPRADGVDNPGTPKLPVQRKMQKQTANSNSIDAARW